MVGAIASPQAQTERALDTEGSMGDPPTVGKSSPTLTRKTRTSESEVRVFGTSVGDAPGANDGGEPLQSSAKRRAFTGERPRALESPLHQARTPPISRLASGVTS
jgi:hypothetical protein